MTSKVLTDQIRSTTGGNVDINVVTPTTRDSAVSLGALQDGVGVYVTTVGGTANAITLTPSPAIPAYVPGQQFIFSATATNTGVTTIAISGLAPLSVHVGGNLCSGGEIVAGRHYRILVVSGSACELAFVSPSIPTLSNFGISEQIVDAKGDLIVGIADDQVTRKAAGPDNSLLGYDSSTSNGLQNVTKGPGIEISNNVIQALEPSQLTNPYNTTQELVFDTTTNWNMNLGHIAILTLTGNTTLATSNLKPGVYVLHVIQDGTGGRTITWPSIVKWPAGSAPPLTSTANARDVFSFVSDGTNLYGSILPDVR